MTEELLKQPEELIGTDDYEYESEEIMERPEEEGAGFETAENDAADKTIHEQAKSFMVTNLWTGETTKNETGSFGITSIEGCGDVTLKVTPNA